MASLFLSDLHFIILMKSKRSTSCLSSMNVVIDSLNKNAEVAVFVSDSNYREQLVNSLNDSFDLAVVLARDLAEFSDLDQDFLPDFIVCEELVTEMKNYSFHCRTLKKLYPGANIISVVSVEDFDVVIECLKNGASGVVVKTDSLSGIRAAIDELQKGGAPLPRSCAKRLIESFQRNLHSPLTSRETDVMIGMSQGKSYRIIARELYVHPETIKTHMKNIYAKLSVRSKAAAIEVAVRDRLI